MITIYKGNRAWYIIEYVGSINDNDELEYKVTYLTGIMEGLDEYMTHRQMRKFIGEHHYEGSRYTFKASE